MPTALILGANGLLGSTLVAEFKKSKSSFYATTRDATSVFGFKTEKFCLGIDSLASICERIGSIDYVINCIGTINHKIDEASLEDTKNAIQTNAIFPHQLDSLAEKSNFHVINIATDCVFNGETGGYLEESQHSFKDTYGMTKSLGEVISKNTLNLRCSIIGMEYKTKFSLMSWLVNQPRDSRVNGYTNHFWNGITTNVYAEVVQGIINAPERYFGTHHLVPADSVSKFELLMDIADKSNRQDLKIEPIDNKNFMDRRLGTSDTEFNDKIWELAGYNTAPKIADMISRYFGKPYVSELLLAASSNVNEVI